MKNQNFLIMCGAKGGNPAQKSVIALMKKTIKQCVWEAKRKLLPSKVRVLPDFLIIGVQKCGTSSLYVNTVQHPYIVPAHRKEIHFFSEDPNFLRGIGWYRDHFPSIFYRCYAKKVLGRNIITGESTPRYLFTPFAAERIYTIMPKVKLIVILRNPVDRAYSHYHHTVRKGVETLPFEKAIKKAEDEVERLYASGFALPRLRYDYLSRGIYVDQLKVWMDIFPKEQFLILKSEDYFASTSAILKRVFEFLNLSSSKMKVNTNGDVVGYGSLRSKANRLNPYKRGKVVSYPEIDEGLRRYLIDYFRPHNQRLYEYLDVDFGWEK